MDALLDAASASYIAGLLEDERDLASLRCTCRFWRDVFSDNPGLWGSLARARFGAAAAAGAPAAAAGAAAAPAGGGAGPAGAGPAGAGPAGAGPAAGAAPGGAANAAIDAEERRYRALVAAARRRPVATLEKVIWLDGMHLERLQDPGASTGVAVRVRSVWWLEIGGRFRGVLPGRYCVAWRMRLEPQFLLQEGNLIARLEAPEGDAAHAGAPAAAAAAADEELWAPENAAARTSMSPIDTNAMFQHRDRAGDAWLELLSSPFEVPQRCDVWAEFQAIRTTYKQGLVFDSVRLLRWPPPALLQLQQQQQQQARQAQQQRQQEGGGLSGLMRRWLRG